MPCCGRTPNHVQQIQSQQQLALQRCDFYPSAPSIWSNRGFNSFIKQHRGLMEGPACWPSCSCPTSNSAWAENQPWRALVCGDSSGTNAEHIWWADTAENYTTKRWRRGVCVGVCELLYAWQCVFWNEQKERVKSHLNWGQRWRNWYSVMLIFTATAFYSSTGYEEYYLYINKKDAHFNKPTSWHKSHQNSRTQWKPGLHSFSSIKVKFPVLGN